MKNMILTAIILVQGIACTAQTKFTFNGKTLRSGKKCLYVNGKKTHADMFTFGTVNEALRHAESSNGRDTLWTDIYIKPSVYWIDNPDDEKERKPRPGFKTPFGMEVRLDRVRIIGMSDNPEDVVLACNRGQTQGADGNFTMFHFTGSNIIAENVTFGNYCNVDLVYPKDPNMNRKRRKDAIVQAQIAICNGDNYAMRNCRFISRLNLCPFVGAQNTSFDECYFECTDDALCGTGVYRKCRFTFFSGKPFYTTDRKKGATFIDCDIHTKTQGTQYLTKVSGPVTMTGCRWTSDDPDIKIEWNRHPDPAHRCVMTGCTLNGKPLCVPTPTEPLPVSLPAFALQVRPDIVPGGWTMDCHKPKDTSRYDWTADNSRSSWGYAEGADGAEGSWGLVQLQKGARIMFTPTDESKAVNKQTCTVTLDPCKGAGQGFGSATGQYLDICIKFDTRTLTGYGIRFIRTPEYDHAVETCLVEYSGGDITPISKPQRCDMFRKGCSVTLIANGNMLEATITNSLVCHTPQKIEAAMPHPNAFGGFHLQHTGSTGASATVIKSIFLK